MAFKHETTLRTNLILIREFPVANGVTVSKGDYLKLVNGAVDLFATGNTTGLGISMTEDDVVGNAGQTNKVKVLCTPGAIFETAQGALNDNAVQPGDYVDINATSDGITTDSNHDFIVWEHDAVANTVKVQLKPSSALFT